LSFPEDGTYHYAVYRYSGSSTISASPARVELTLEGQTRVFVPPAGTAMRWWNVFDIVVAGGSITIVPVQTWSNSKPVASRMGARSRSLPFVMPVK
ncbi:MAG: hypothetical protein V3U64_00080, partial [Cocleimonas sp.]